MWVYKVYVSIYANDKYTWPLVILTRVYKDVAVP